jgi:hypothetical protein
MLNRDLTARSSSAFLIAMFASALAAPSCSLGKPDIATVPVHPTFEIDVKPLLADHCLLCHSYPATRGAPTSFRLDVYDPPVGTSTPAAHQEASRFIQSIDSGKMPPAALWGDGVGPNGKALLQNWKTDGYPD